MTAIGISGTNEGFIIGADGRKRMDDISRAALPDRIAELESMDTQKIFPLLGSDKSIAYALAGNVINVDPPFDAVEECAKLAESASSRDYQDATKLVNGFSKTLTVLINQAKHFPQCDQNAEGSWKIMELMFTGYLRRVPFLTYVEFYHSYHFAEFHSQSLSLAGILYGSDVVRRAMYDDFGNVVPESPFSQYIQNPREIRSLDDSERYVKGYIQACSSESADPKPKN